MFEQVPAARSRMSPISPDNRLIPLREAAGILSVSTVTVRRHVRSGRLPHIRINGRLYFKRTDLNSFINAHWRSFAV